MSTLAPTLPVGPAVVARPVHGRSIGRVRAGARATLALGILASLAANVLAANPSPIGRVIAAWPPVALLVTVELLSRVPAAPGWLSRLRIVAAATIAGIAAWISYHHMVQVALAYGEASTAAHLLPLSVDGLVVVASVCLVELNRNTELVEPQAEAGPVAGAPPPAEVDDPTGPAEEPPARTSSRATAPAARSTASKRDRVLRLADQHPDWTQARLADAAGCTIRTVRRHLNAPASHGPAEGTDRTPDADRPEAAEPTDDPTSDTVPTEPVAISANGHADPAEAIR